MGCHLIKTQVRLRSLPLVGWGGTGQLESARWYGRLFETSLSDSIGLGRQGCTKALNPAARLQGSRVAGLQRDPRPGGYGRELRK
jgi:hypothetical protein